MNMKFKNKLLLLVIVSILGSLAITSCDIIDPDDTVEPAYLKINLSFINEDNSYQFQTFYFDSVYLYQYKYVDGVLVTDSILFKDTTVVTDYLFLKASDFKLFNDDSFSDVFQKPDQFFQQDSLYQKFNVFDNIVNNKSIQVAHGAIAPYSEKRNIEYDSLFFVLRPIFDEINLGGFSRPLRSTGIDENSGEEISTIIKIRNKFKFEEGSTYTLNIRFKIKNILYRVYDEFLFNAVYDSYELTKD